MLKQEEIIEKQDEMLDSLHNQVRDLKDNNNYYYDYYLFY